MGSPLNEVERVVELVLPATALAPGEARAELRRFADRLPGDILEDTLLLACEVVTNSVCHGASGSESRIHLRVAASAAAVRVDVWDWGPGFERDAVGRPRSDGEGGFGLHLVEQLSSRWGVERDGATHVWFEIDRTPRQRARGASARHQSGRRGRQYRPGPRLGPPP